MPVFIDTLRDLKTTQRFQEKYGSYPVLRVRDLNGNDIGGRIDTNRTAGIVGVSELLKQLVEARQRFEKGRR